MSSARVYLAGPILGCDRGEANDWRNDFKRQLEDIGIRGISPLRCEPLIGATYTADYPDPRFGTPKAIQAKNFFDVKKCDLTLAYFPDDVTEKLGVSIGTIAEVNWAFAIQKPTIVVSTHPKIRRHPVLVGVVNWMLDDLDQAFETIAGLLTDYVRPL